MIKRNCNKNLEQLKSFFSANRLAVLEKMRFVLQGNSDRVANSVGTAGHE